MESKKQYADRDRQAQGAYYVTHVGAMTAEGLHSKARLPLNLHTGTLKLLDCTQKTPHCNPAMTPRGWKLPACRPRSPDTVNP